MLSRRRRPAGMRKGLRRAETSTLAQGGRRLLYARGRSARLFLFSPGAGVTARAWRRARAASASARGSPGCGSASSRQKRERVIHHLEVADLVPDHVVEHRLGRKQQPPVEAHRAGPRATRPAGPLPADRQPRVGRADERAGAVQAGLDLGPRRPSVPALERRAPAPHPTARAACRPAAPRGSAPGNRSRAPASAPDRARCRPARPPRPALRPARPPVARSRAAARGWPPTPLARARAAAARPRPRARRRRSPGLAVPGPSGAPVDDLFHGATEYGQRRRTWWTTFSTPQGYGPLPT